MSDRQAGAGRSLLKWLARPLTRRLSLFVEARIDARDAALRAELATTHAMIDWQLNELRDHCETLRRENRNQFAALDDLRGGLAGANTRVDVLAAWLEGVAQSYAQQQERLDELQAWLSAVSETTKRLPPPERSAKVAGLINRLERTASRLAGDRKEELALTHRLGNIESALAAVAAQYEGPRPTADLTPVKASPRSVWAK